MTLWYYIKASRSYCFNWERKGKWEEICGRYDPQPIYLINKDFESREYLHMEDMLHSMHTSEESGFWNPHGGL